MFGARTDSDYTSLHDSDKEASLECLSYANLCRTAALGRTHRRNVDPNDSEAVELHRGSLFYPHRCLGFATNVIECGLQSSDQRTRCSRKGGGAYVELGYNISGYRADCRCFGPKRRGRRGNSDRLDSVRRVLDPISRGLGHGSKTARLVTRRLRRDL